MVAREHVVSYRNGPQVMVAGLKLREMGYCRGASVVVSDSSGDHAHTPWQFVVSNDEHATLVSANPTPPEWIQRGVRVWIDVQPPDGRVPRAEGLPRDLSEVQTPARDEPPPQSGRFTPNIVSVSDAPTFRGNVGNLLQHWVLCEILSACQNHYERLGFIDAYAMAPFANRQPKRDTSAMLFDAVAHRLPGAQSLYERAWLRLAPNTDEYPNSAAFLTVAWRGRYAMLLCESDLRTVQLLERWASVAQRFPGCEAVEIAAGDWRDHFRGQVLTSSDLRFLSFDPYMFDRHGSGQNPGNMDPTDLDRVVDVVGSAGSVVVQLSTYSANNDNAQDDVREIVASRLERAGFQQVARARANGNMMSLVFARDVDGMQALHSLPERFEAWLAVSAKYVVHPERSEKNGVTTLPFSSEEAPDDAPS